MMLFGVIWLIVASKLPNKEVTYIYPENGEKPQINANNEETARERNKRRKLRKQLK